MSDDEKKKREELACAQCFLKWYSSRHEVEFNSPVRAEEVFPELKVTKNWDFVAIPKSGNNEQKLALEVKRIIRPTFERQCSQWSLLLKQVSQNLQNTLSGTFDVFTYVNLNPPKSTKFRVLNINHAGYPQLVDILTDNIGKAVVSMNQSDQIDLGPRILSVFPSWPIQYIKNSPTACVFYLLKSSNKGNCIRLAPGDAFCEEAAMNEALETLDMTTQLRLARCKDFQQTAFLLNLDSLFSWDPETIKKWLIGTDFNESEVSGIYLVQVSCSRVEEVWPDG